MKTHLDYNKIVKIILENNKLIAHKKLCINLLSKSLEIEPNFFGTYHLLGTYYNDLGDFLNSEINYKKSIQLNKNNISSYLNLFTLYYKNEKIYEAINLSNELINLEIFDSSDFYTELGMLYLLNGDFENGWKYYERHKLIENLNDIIKYEGEVVIVTEQGIGDNILFCRYGKLLKDMGVKVSYACSNKLINLIKSMGIYYKVYDVDKINYSQQKKYISLLNLPAIFNINSLNSKIKEPYFFVSKEKVNYWKSKINSKKIIVGINWQGKKDPENGMMEGRSFELKKFESISKLPHIQLVSLQSGYGREQLGSCEFADKIIDFGDNLSLDDISAIIMNCDIVITPCTMIAHLSGALGKKTWTLIKRIPYWFWGLNTENNIWYSSMKLFRQNKNNQWENVFSRVKNDLLNIKKDRLFGLSYN